MLPSLNSNNPTGIALPTDARCCLLAHLEHLCVDISRSDRLSRGLVIAGS